MTLAILNIYLLRILTYPVNKQQSQDAFIKEKDTSKILKDYQNSLKRSAKKYDLLRKSTIKQSQSSSDKNTSESAVENREESWLKIYARMSTK